jgi:uncharacterized protein with FMN-binding domain
VSRFRCEARVIEGHCPSMETGSRYPSQAFRLQGPDRNRSMEQTMSRSIRMLITGAAAVIPLTGTFLGAAPLPTPTTLTAAHAAGAVTTRTIVGPSVNMRWGPVRVTIIVKGKQLTDLKVTAPIERARSAIINNRAVPVLRSEVLTAQGHNVHSISGATMTSNAFLTSLQAALKQAGL